MTKSEVISMQLEYRYSLLNRLRQDCEYYLGCENRNARNLWSLDEKEQIKNMKLLYNSFSSSQKPEWINMKIINMYEQQMCI